MLPSEMTDLLKRLAAADGRFVFTTETAKLAVSFWFDCIGDLDYGDALQAAADYYRTQTDHRIMPGDIREGVTQIRRARLSTLPPVEELMADVNPDDPRYNIIWRERRDAAMTRPVPAPRALPNA